MILTKDQLDRLMSTDKQAIEVSRILNAFSGEVLFTLHLNENADVIETLFNRSGVHYEKRRTGSDIVEYVKIK